MKISELPTTASVNGTEAVPLVQSGTTKTATLTVIKNWLTSVLSFLSLDFITGQPDPAVQVGRMFWDDSNGVVAFYNAAGEKVEVGQTVIVSVRNTTGATLTKGTVVYINGATGQLPTVAKADADAEVTSASTIGFVDADITNNSNGYVQIGGVLHNVDTSAFSDGATLWLSPGTAGTATSTRPTSPDHAVQLGTCVYSHAVNGKILISVQNGYELNELHDVSITGAAALQMLRRNVGNTAWENFDLFGTAGAWTAPQRSALLTDNDGSFDLSAKQNIKCTPTGAVALTFTNHADGLSGSVLVINTTNYQFTAAATTKISTTALSRLSATGTYRIDFIDDGTNAYCTVSENLA